MVACATAQARLLTFSLSHWEPIVPFADETLAGWPHNLIRSPRALNCHPSSAICASRSIPFCASGALIFGDMNVRRYSRHDGHRLRNQARTLPRPALGIHEHPPGAVSIPSEPFALAKHCRRLETRNRRQSSTVPPGGRGYSGADEEDCLAFRPSTGIQDVSQVSVRAACRLCYHTPWLAD